MVNETGSSRRILVVANETLDGDAIHEVLASRHLEAGGVQAFVVAPALNSRLRHWASDIDRARREAERRLRRCIERLELEGITAQGWVGDSNPMQALTDALQITKVDEVLIATHPEGRSNWLERGLVDRARAAVDLPLMHVVVDTTPHVAVLAGRAA
ncbi:MAG: hypothetical protein F2663_01440 [Actinobacteria bacterium]|uniref:Unannotated protein n=1 Tax=freshwater metagenome TaxID=449393 RepID=A0A6J6NNM1_9ZZZZ|nr:hypothetical protein [Actinomycetota bacterium]